MIKFLNIFFLVISLPALSQVKKDSLLLFDGLYETKCVFEESDDEGSQEYIRFYPNGKVITVDTDCEGSASELKDWFNINDEQANVGDYFIIGRKIKFSTKGKNGIVKYKGKINKQGVIKLKWKSLINGANGKDIYRFVKVDGLS